MSKTIGIIGCGWLGFPLGLSFLNDGYTIHGTTTSPEKLSQLKASGISPFLVSLFEDRIEGEIHSFLHSVTILIINIPPKLRSSQKENYVQKIKLLWDEIQKSTVRKVIFISSTSVYGETEGQVTEATLPKPITQSGKQLMEVETILKNHSSIDTTIVRFGGLIGPDRHPIYHLAGKKELPNGNDPINLIHLDDCIGIVKTIVEQGYWNELFNAVYPMHPPKKTYYTTQAQKRGLNIPEYLENGKSMGKEIHSRQLINVKKYTFKTSIEG